MVGANLAHYRIVRPIGAGGMGEVFLAEDTKLGRDVALKVLPHALAADPERRDRFDREARAVAALNHPNIITIHSVEEHEGVLFLTMELVEGKTLSEIIPRQGMSLEQWLQVAITLSDAVGAAHQRGITHRDLKPANVMVSDEGRVKVLDFGLAKLQQESPGDGVAETMTKGQLTGEGRILGTVAYMSPEQAQGKPVDARSDVFSLGIVLFEMATGETPFKGDTSMSVLSAIIKDTPASVTELRQDLPREVGRVLRRCLAKDPDERYQTAKDLRNELRLLKEDLASDAATRSRVTTGVSRTTVLPASRSRTWSAVLLASGVVAAVAGGWWYSRHFGAAPTPAFAAIKPIQQLTHSGTVWSVAISPDGRYVVHDDGSPDKPSLWMRQVSTSSSTQIVAPAAGIYSGLAFSPDDESVLYLFTPANSTAAPTLYRIPLLGNVLPRKLVEDISTPPAFSADGTRMAFIRDTADRKTVIMLANTDGTGQRLLASRADLDPYVRTRVAWSPDSKLIAAFAGTMPTKKSRIVLVNVETGTEQPFSEARFDDAGQLAWLADGSALVFDAVEQYGGRWNWNSQLWTITYPAGTVRRITPDAASYSGIAATATGRTIVAVRDDVRDGLWVAPEGDTSRARPITATTNGREGATGIDWTPDNRIIYSAATQGSWDIWIANSDGTQPTQLTSDPGVENQPRILPDGKGIVFTSRENGGDDVLVRAIDLDGGNPRPIATGGAIYRGYVQVAGDHIYFKVLEAGRPVAYRVPLAGGSRERIFADSSRLPPGFVLTSVSPDERLVVGRYAGPTGSGLAVVSIAGEPVRRFPYTYSPAPGFAGTWAPGGHAIEDLVVRDGAVNLWRFPLDGSAPRAVTTFPSDQIMNYRWSRDGRFLAMSRGTESSDVVLITSDDKDDKKE